MPATRTHLSHSAKRKAILDAAEGLFLRLGYDETRVAAVAAAAGVANNAVYWYFPSKDDLLAAVLERRLDGAAGMRDELAGATTDEAILRALAALDEVAPLTASVHERAQHSRAVAEVHDRFHQAAGELLRRLFCEAGLSAEDSVNAAAAVMGLIEGIHLHEVPRDKGSRDALVLWTVQRLATRSAA